MEIYDESTHEVSDENFSDELLADMVDTLTDSVKLSNMRKDSLNLRSQHKIPPRKFKQSFLILKINLIIFKFHKSILWKKQSSTMTMLSSWL